MYFFKVVKCEKGLCKLLSWFSLIHTTLFSLVSNNIDALQIFETKIDNTFPVSQFCVPGYLVPFKLDPTRNGGGIMLYVKEHILVES